MNEIILQTRTSFLGKLELIDYVQVYGSHPRAEHYHVLYKLKIKSKEIEGTFSDKYLIHDDFIFITELKVQEKDGCGILEHSSLECINTKTFEKKSLSKIEDGFVYPLRVEENKIIYTKEKNRNSAIHEFEQEIIMEKG